MGKTRGPYCEEFPVGTNVRIAGAKLLSRFKREWTYHHPLQSEQIQYAGQVETYPSGRVVKNALDADGMLQQVQSKKNSADFLRPYASNIAYNSAGAVTTMKPGNGLWENTRYKSRLQPTQTSVEHSVRVIDAGSEGGESIHKKGDKWTADPRPTIVGSKGGITPYVSTTPAEAWREPAVLLYYGKKAGN